MCRSNVGLMLLKFIVSWLHMSADRNMWHGSQGDLTSCNLIIFVVSLIDGVKHSQIAQLSFLMLFHDSFWPFRRQSKMADPSDQRDYRLIRNINICFENLWAARLKFQEACQNHLKCPLVLKREKNHMNYRTRFPLSLIQHCQSISRERVHGT